MTTKTGKKKTVKTKQATKGFMEISVKKLKPAEWNYKKDDDEKALKLLSNIKRNGQLENIIVRDIGRGKFEVVNGNHRLPVFKELGIDPMVFNLGKITQAEAERIAIETNETRFETDHIALAERIAGLMDEWSIEDLAATMPYTEEELDGMAKLLDFDWEQFNSDEDEDSQGDGNGDEEPPVSITGDEWEIGSHLLIVGEGNTEKEFLAADEAVLGWQRVSGEEAKLKGTDKTFQETKNDRQKEEG